MRNSNTGVRFLPVEWGLRGHGPGHESNFAQFLQRTNVKIPM